MRLLLLEDEKKVADFVARGLKAERFAMNVGAAGQNTLDLATACNYYLIILDFMN